MDIFEKRYQKVSKQLMKDLKLSNPHQLPKILKVSLNMGLGDLANNDKNVISEGVEALSTISGQKAVVTRARKSEAGFKIRQDWPIGCKVTLRRSKMEAFLDKLVMVVLPRVRDFRGISKRSFDQGGNYSMGIREYVVFPEIDFDKVKHMLGMDIVMTIQAREPEHAYQLLKLMGFPFRD